MDFWRVGKIRRWQPRTPSRETWTLWQKERAMKMTWIFPVSALMMTHAWSGNWIGRIGAWLRHRHGHSHRHIHGVAHDWVVHELPVNDTTGWREWRNSWVALFSCLWSFFCSLSGTSVDWLTWLICKIVNREPSDAGDRPKARSLGYLWSRSNCQKEKSQKRIERTLR